MRRIAGGIALILVSILSGMGLSPSPVRGDPAPLAVKIGLIDTITRGIPPSWTQIAMRPFKALMEAETGMNGEVVLGGDALSLAKDLENDKIQVGVFHGHEYAWAKQKYPMLKVIAVCVNTSAAVKIHLVVRSDSKAGSYADLKGKVISVPRMGRAQCRIYLERRCIKPGMTPEKFYSRVETPFMNEDALNDVIDGDVDAAVVDAVALESYRKGNPTQGKRLRSVAQSEPFPGGVIAYCPGRFSEEKVARFRAGLIDAKSTARGRETLKMLHVNAFELPPADHDATLAAIAKAYPPTAPCK